jgi:hypothetical protein
MDHRRGIEAYNVTAKMAKNSRRGSKPGERRGGRAKGTLNKATADVKAMASQYTEAAMRELGRLSLEAESEPARVSAIKELLDRAYGKAPIAVDLDARLSGAITATWLPPAS